MRLPNYEKTLGQHRLAAATLQYVQRAPRLQLHTAAPARMQFCELINNRRKSTEYGDVRNTRHARTQLTLFLGQTALQYIRR